jgi:hypothetical protein
MISCYPITEPKCSVAMLLVRLMIPLREVRLVFIFLRISTPCQRSSKTAYILPCSEKILGKIGARFGSIGLFCMIFLFLPVSRGSVLLRLIDIPFEHATRYHVWLGHLTMSLFTMHGLCYLIKWFLEGRLLKQVSAKRITRGVEEFRVISSWWKFPRL